MSGNKKPEAMAEFFDARASGYDQHMQETLGPLFSEYYRAVAGALDQTTDNITVLDLGCGTGAELEALFVRVPRARVTGVDLSQEMLQRLRERFSQHADRLTLVRSSYLGFAYPEAEYDYVVSVMTMHHLLHSTKTRLYGNIRKALKPGGKYIEGDYVVTPEQERQFLAEYEEKTARLGPARDGDYHIDIPFSVETQARLLEEAGFSRVEVVWHHKEAAVLVAYA